MMKIGVVGIGRVGLPLASVLSKHYDTVGVDVDQKTVERVNSGKGFTEPSVEEYLHNYGLRATTDFSVLKECEVVCICVGSQTPGIGYSSDRFISALKAVSPSLVARDQLLVISTTLPPQDIRRTVIPYISVDGLEQRIAGVCYNPAMIALGRAIKDFEEPSYIMIGESNKEAGLKLERVWRKVIGQGVKVFHSTIAGVGIAKYALNVALVSKISLLSFLTEFCEREGGDVDLVTEILRSEPRVAGPKMFKGGLGYGGTCFPVDVEAARHESEDLGIPTSFMDALTALNDWQVERSIRMIASYRRKKVAILGVSFKPGTDVVVSSQPLEIARGLASSSFDVMVFDPRAMEEARRALHSTVRYATTAKEAIAFGDVIFLGVEWPEFATLRGSDFRHDQVVLDPWRLLRDSPPPGIYVPFGVGR